MAFAVMLVLNQLDTQTSQGLLPVSAAAPQQPDSNNQNGEKKDGEEKKEGSDDKNKEKDGEEPKGPPPVKPEVPQEPPNPINTEVTWSDEGAVQFSFHRQPWKLVLEWIADASRLTLQWQELPGDALNLTTTRAYTLEEARDLLNRLLLSRGYTMLLHGEIMEIVKTADLKSSLVPRVSPEQLDDVPDHSIVKVSFNLDWLIADEAVTELKPMLTDAGRISQLSRTNRLEVIDTAVSLREIRNILKAEQSDAGQEQLVRTFHLEHRRASDVITLLRSLLGLENPTAPGPTTGMDPRMMQQAMQQMQRMMQQAQQNKGGTPAKEEQKTRLVLNNRENMILAQAAPDQMAIIEKAIAEIDVPAQPGSSLLQNMNRMKVYRLETVDPQTLVDLLRELGDLDPGTMLKVDKNKKAILAWAGIADHLTITTLVSRLDSSGREFDVIPLRRLDAEYVAGTIMTLMGPKEEEEDNNSRYRYYYYSSRQNEDKDDEPGFRVDADLQDNRLLVYANPVEMDEIHRLLQKLGELPDPNGRDDGYRVFELNPGDSTDAIKRQLEQLWRRNNKLEFSLPPEKQEVQPKADDTTTAHPRSSTAPTLVAYPDDTQDASATSDDAAPDSPDVDIEQLFRDAGSTDSEKPSGEAAPVRISISDEGRMIVSCDDPVALAEFEDLLRHVAKPSQKYKVFTLEYASPSWVALTLEEYFESDEEDDGYLDWWGFYRSSRKKSDKHSLSQRRIPQFIYDTYTSTILVRNADSRQLQTIAELIEIYDVPEPADTRAMRVTKFFHLQNAKAETVSQAVKDVFRDLLSSNDKALEKPGGEQQQRSTSRYSFMGGGDDDDDDEPIRFKGLLSIGIDRESNTLVVSSTSGLMTTIEAMVEELDKAALKSSGMRILHLDPTVDLGLIQDKLSKIVGPDVGARPGRNSQPKQNGPNQPDPRQQQQQAAGNS